MSLAQDIMDAVKKGGMNKWQPETSNHKQKMEAAERSEDILEVMGNEKWIVADLAEATGINESTTRKHLEKMVDNGILRKISLKQPYRYFKA